MASGGREIVLIFGESRWPREKLAAQQQNLEVVHATSVNRALEALLPHMPCRVNVVTPPDVAATVDLIDTLTRCLRVPVTTVDGSRDPRVERFCRLAGTNEHHVATVDLSGATDGPLHSVTDEMCSAPSALVRGA